MATPFTPFQPSTGPNFNPNAYTYSKITIPLPGYSYSAGLSPNNIPDPGPPAADINGILLEPSQNSFLALEASQGGPTSVLIQEP